MKRIYALMDENPGAGFDFRAYTHMLNMRRSYWGTVFFFIISALYTLSDFVMDVALPEYNNLYTTLDYAFTGTFLVLALIYHRIVHRFHGNPLRVLSIILFYCTVAVFVCWGLLYSYFDIVKVGNNNLYPILCVSLVIVFHLSMAARIIIFANVIVVNILMYLFNVRNMDNLLFIFSNSVIVIVIGIIASHILYSERRYNFMTITELLGLKKEKSRVFLDTFRITPKEAEVIHLLAMGRTYREIADDLIISEYTVKTHIKNIYEKTGVSNKVQLINLMNEHSAG